MRALTGYEWPCSTRRSAPVAASHTRTVLSSEPDTMSRPSGENAKAWTELGWLSVCACC